MRTSSLKVACAVAVVALSCGQQPAPTATLTVSLEGNGVVRSTPLGIDCGAVCSAPFDVGKAITLTAEPAPGFVFAAWGGACSGSGACAFILSEDRTVTARFTPETRTLTVALIGDGAGSVASSPAGLACPGTCVFAQPKGTSLTLTASPAPTSAFVGWTGGGCSGTGECTVRLDADVTIQVAFALKHSLVVSRTGTGVGTVTSAPAGIDCGADCSESFAPGTEVTLTAAPATGSTFGGWSGACSGMGTCRLIVASPLMATATFTRLQHTLTVTKLGAGSGTITSAPPGITCGSDCAEAFDVGAVVTLTATPAMGSQFTGWSGACTGLDPCVVTMSGAVDVSATFAVDRSTVAVNRTGTGSGRVVSSPPGIDCGADCEEPFDHGTIVTLTATPAVGASFDGWSGGGCAGTGPCTFTVTGQTAITASFTMGANALTVLLAGTGAGTVVSAPPGITCGADCTENFTYGTRVTLTAAAATGSTFSGWSGGGCSGTGTCTLDVTQPTSVTAVFALNQYPLVVAKSGAGSGSVTSMPAGIACGTDCSESYGHGTVVVLTATPDASSTFAGWSGACTGTGICTVTLEAAATVGARFELRSYTLTVARAGTGTGTVTSTPAGISCGSDCSESYTHGTAVTLTAVASTGTTFAGWTGGCSGTGTCVVTLTAPTSVMATFTLNQYLLSVQKNGTGSGTVSSSPTGISCGTDCSQSYDYGLNVTLTATPASAASYFVGWAGACSGASPTCVLSMTAARSVTATFDRRGFLFAVADGTDTVQRGDPVTGAMTNVGLLGVTYAFGDLAWGNNTLFMVDGRGARGLYSVNTSTGAATLIGLHNVTDLFAIAFHPGTNTLYGAAGTSLYRLNTSTGAATLVGATGVTAALNGLAWDSTRGRMVGITASLASANVYSINLSTGAATALATGLAGIDNNGWTYDPASDHLVAVDYAGNVWAYNPTTFTRQSMATGLGAHTGVAFVP